MFLVNGQNPKRLGWKKMGKVSWATPLMLLLSGVMCYFAVRNYVNKELNRGRIYSLCQNVFFFFLQNGKCLLFSTPHTTYYKDIYDMDYEEVKVYVKSYLSAMALGIGVSLVIHSSEV
jgi:hypothetical protein